MNLFAGLSVNTDEEPDTYDPSDCRCPHCGQQFNGSDSSGGHCSPVTGGCCQSFASPTAFTKHLVSRDYSQPQCLTPEQMLAKGWARTGPHDSWRTPAPQTNPWRRTTP